MLKAFQNKLSKLGYLVVSVLPLVNESNSDVTDSPSILSSSATFSSASASSFSSILTTNSAISAAKSQSSAISGLVRVLRRWLRRVVTPESSSSDFLSWLISISQDGESGLGLLSSLIVRKDKFDVCRKDGCFCTKSQHLTSQGSISWMLMYRNLLSFIELTP